MPSGADLPGISTRSFPTVVRVVTSIPTRAREAPAGTIPIPEPLRMRLGQANSRLGRDAVSGVRFADPRPGIVYSIGPMSSHEAGGRYRDLDQTRRMIAAATAVTPAGRPFRIVYNVHPDDRAMRLGDAGHGVLGRITYRSGGTSPPAGR